MDLKKLYRQFCRRTGRDYFNNYSEMVTNLNLNPNSSRKTNLNIVNRYCKIKKDKWKIYLYDFVTPKQSRKESKKISLKRHSYNSLIKEYFYLLDEVKEQTNYYINGYFYLSKSEIRETLGFLKPFFKNRTELIYISDQINIIKNMLLPDSGDCTADFVKDYLFEVKSMANGYIKDVLKKSPEIIYREVYVVYDKHWSKTYITDAKTIDAFKEKQKELFKNIASKCGKGISNVRDLIFFKNERELYYTASLEYLQKNICEDAIRFEDAYEICVNKIIPHISIELALNEIKTIISEKFHQTMVTKVKNNRVKFSRMDNYEGNIHIAEMQIEAEKDDIIYGKRTKKIAIQRASNDNIISTAFINFMLIHNSTDSELFLEELNEYILNDPKNDNANAADKEMKKIIRKLRNKNKQISEDLAELEKRKQKSEDINEIRQMLLDNLEDMLD